MYITVCVCVFVYTEMCVCVYTNIYVPGCLTVTVYVPLLSLPSIAGSVDGELSERAEGGE